MDSPHELEARLRRLDERITQSLALARQPGRVTHEPVPASHELEAARIAAEQLAALQAQRCADLEARLALVSERLSEETAARQSAEQQLLVLADTVTREREARLAAEAALSSRAATASAGGLDPHFQATLLEIDRLTAERDVLRRSTNDLRERARSAERELGELRNRVAKAERELGGLLTRDEQQQRRIVELERQLATQQRDLELAERRTAHLRQRLDR